jgi:hypothetical protein
LGEIHSLSFSLPLYRRAPPTGVQHHHYNATPTPARRETQPYLTLPSLTRRRNQRAHPLPRGFERKPSATTAPPDPTTHLLAHPIGRCRPEPP